MSEPKNFKTRIQMLRQKLNADARKVWGRMSSSMGSRDYKIPSIEEIKPKLQKAQWALIVIMGLLVADLLWLGVGSVLLNNAPQRSSRVSNEASKIEVPYIKSKMAYNGIVSRNIFCPGCPVPDIKSRAAERPKDCNKARPFPNGGPKLIGTIVLSQPEFSVATVSGGGSESDAIKKGDAYRNYGKVYEIRRDRVCFENQDGLLFFTALPEERDLKFGQPLPTAMAPTGGDGIQRSGDDSEVQIQRSFLLKQIQDPNLLMQAHAVPYMENGEIRGYQLLSVNPGSVFEQLGFAPQDVISELNGEPITSLAKAQQAYSEIGSVSELSITVLRGGRPVTRVFKVK